MSLSARLTPAMMLRDVLAAGAVGALPYHNIEAAVLPAEVARLDAPARMQAANLVTHVALARADGLARPMSLKGFIRAPAAGGIGRSGAKGSLRDGPANALQQTAAREFFTKAVSLKRGEDDVSPLVLKGVIQTPYVPERKTAMDSARAIDRTVRDFARRQVIGQVESSWFTGPNLPAAKTRTPEAKVMG